MIGHMIPVPTVQISMTQFWYWSNRSWWPGTTKLYPSNYTSKNQINKEKTPLEEKREGRKNTHTHTHTHTHTKKTKI